jgi:hypothetical protein
MMLEGLACQPLPSKNAMAREYISIGEVEYKTALREDVSGGEAE